jgi:lysozyme
MRIAGLLLVSSLAHAVVVCPGANSQYGIDVSEFQGTIDWPQVKASGKAFAIIRVSDGTGHLDPDFARNWSGAKSAGLIRGVYQFFEPGGDAVAQANLLLSKMGPVGPGDLPPMIDVEVTGGQSPSTINNKIHQWIDTVQNATGRKPLIYTGGWFWNPDVQSADFTSYPLVDSYYCSNCCPNIASPWTKWAIWQYSSTGSVGGISGNVDLDRFDGTIDELNLLAGGSFDWSANYVSQSWPLASSALEMTVNQSISADIVFKNTGTKSWTDNTRLGTTQPRDRASVFAGPDWIGPNRAAGCSAGAAPGATCKLSFTWHAPDKPGDYHEFFSLVDEGVAWFSDPGQGGPPDNQVEAWIHVSEAEYHAQLSATSWSGDVNLSEGSDSDGWIELKNVGTQPWKAGVTKLAPLPRDHASLLAASDWLSSTRVSTVAADVAPGAIGRFALSLHGAAAGDYPLQLGLVEENVTWFADAPKGGGPGSIPLHVIVAASGGNSGMSSTTGMSGTSGGSSGTSGSVSGMSSGGRNLPANAPLRPLGPPSSVAGGCSYAPLPAGNGLLLVLILAISCRVRGRARPR